MADLQLKLTAFLREAAAAPFQFGEWDCAMFLANWVRLVTGEDPARELRNAYRSERGWQRIVNRAVGLDQLVGRLAIAAGLHEVQMARPGDIAVVETLIGPTGGIAVPRGFACKVGRGLRIGPATILRAWSF